MALTEKDRAEIRRLAALKMVLDSRTETDNIVTAEQVIARAKKFEDYITGEPESDEKI